jgi:hypothetical protein
MKVNEIIVEGPFSSWVGGHLQNLGQRLGAKDTTALTAQTQAAALDQRVKEWLQAKQQYTTAGLDMTKPVVYKKALDQWLASQYNAPPVSAILVNDNTVKNYIAKSFANKMVAQQTPTTPPPSQLQTGYAFPRPIRGRAKTSITDTQGHTYTYTFPAAGVAQGQWSYNGTAMTQPEDIQTLNKLYQEKINSKQKPAPATP